MYFYIYMYIYICKRFLFYAGGELDDTEWELLKRLPLDLGTGGPMGRRGRYAAINYAPTVSIYIYIYELSLLS